MELYKQYLMEREGAFLVYNDNGFMSYKQENEVVLILDAYVKKESRNLGITKEFLNEIVNKTNCKKVICTTDLNANGQQMSEIVILALGFNKSNTKDSTVYYIKEIL